MQAAVLKGYKDGYELILRDNADFDKILVELKDLFRKLQLDTIEEEKQVSFTVNSGNRLLDAKQKQKIEKLVGNYQRFSIHKFVSDVIRTEDALEFMEEHTVHLNTDTIRNGQVKTITGDVLFLGNVHKGGILQATGSIFVLGSVEGVLHAGYRDNVIAVIAGNFKEAQQIRISDLVDIIETDKQEKNVVAYVNDLHAVSYTTLSELKTLRPKIFTQVGGF
ncbi:septum site-determining protein MinC [Ligilactobacillus apodemi]|uniref:Probable septum site-determining protein MinC n=1 Tax=Ligilactobacillus apodemi DSM 16634 = JCM 16172 TaxID=1423724 RepID=A0A0R1TS02_9LACO|nr:septum site-determining protein MinC [Ligilactobacillus apodemi]KRL84161.1 cell division inhibitor [Ligilactobacillus apodemi DSM 16634 = JCM 16172]MCR1901204.1 cell division inhibitor [Ligilactobacillus apodemi]